MGKYNCKDDLLLEFDPTNKSVVGQEPWSSGYGKRLTCQRLCVQIPAPYTGWTFFHKNNLL